MRPYLIGVDLGGTQVRAALSDASGQIYKRVVIPTDAEQGVYAVIEKVQYVIDHVMPQPSQGSVAAIGLAAPGPLDSTTGIVVLAPNLPGWHNVPLRSIIAEKYSIPTYLGNDANLAALAEHQFGAGRNISDMIYLTISTGIGSGIIVDGKLLLGSHGFAAEVGHMTIEANGPRCSCGNIGCLEALASGPSIARHAIDELKNNIPSAVLQLVNGEIDRITAKDLHDVAVAGDQFARDQFARAGFYLGVGIGNLLHLFNPQMVILGGSVAKAGSLLMDSIWETIRTRIPNQYWEPLSIAPAVFGDDVVLIGAIAFAGLQVF